MAGDESEKSHEPTQKRLRDARSKGDFPKSIDLNTFGSYLGFAICISLFCGVSVRAIFSVLIVFLTEPDALSKKLFVDPFFIAPEILSSKFIYGLSYWFAIPAFAVIIVIVCQRSLVFSFEKVKFRYDRVSVVKNFQNKFGMSGLFEFGKSLFKLLLFSSILFFFLMIKAETYISLPQFGVRTLVEVLRRDTIIFFVIATAVAFGIGCIDYLFQFKNHMQKLRMSRKELTDELKESEGDPYLKQRRRSKAEEIAGQRTLQDVPSADVVIVNPTHYAVALKWSREKGSAPECVAKGVDQIALKIREIALEAGVPIRHDPATARALHATLDVGDEVHPDHYQSVAAAIRFSEKIRAKSKAFR